MTSQTNSDKRGFGGFMEKPFSLWTKLMLFVFCAGAAAAKLTYYYSMMGVSSHMDILVGITLFFLVVMYNAFENKTISRGLYFTFTALMIADAVYYSFFNRYLSVAIAGAVGLVGDVQDSVLEVIKPSVFLLLADCFLLVLVNRLLLENKKRCQAAGTWKEQDQAPSGLLERMFLSVTSREGRIKALSAGLVVLCCLTLANPKEESFLTAVVNQEFFTYHLRDASGLMEQEDSSMDHIGEILAVEGSYDQEKLGPEFGIAKGRNLIVIQVEAMQNLVIGASYKGQEITPNLNRLIEKDSFYFDTYYQQLGSGNTSDAEFATNNSLYGSMKSYTYEIYKDNYFRGLPVLLGEKGYHTMAFHAYDGDYWSRETAYPGQGFEEFYSGEDFGPGEMLGMGLSDRDMFLQSAEILSQKTQPFYAFMVTLSSHHPFDISGGLDISQDTESTFENYLQSMNYVDSSISAFIQELKEKGLYDNSVIVIYGDHFGLNPKDEEVNRETSDYLGTDYWYETAMNIPLIIHIPGCGMEKTVSTPGGQVDFLPTIAYLMGFDELDTIYFGHNLLTAEDNFVPIRAYVQRGSFVSGDVMFQMSPSRIFSDGRAVNIRNGKEVEDIQALKELYIRSVQLTNTSDYYLDHDVLRQVYQEGKTLEACLGIQEEGEKEEASSLDTVIVDATNGTAAGEGVYCVENMDALYSQGVRSIKVKLLYTADNGLVVMDQPSDLSRYFSQPRESYTYEQFCQDKQAPADPAVTAMTLEDLALWMQEHPQATVYMELGEETLGEKEGEIHSIYLIRTFSQLYPELSEQAGYYLHTGEEVERANLEGYDNILFDVAGQGYTEQELMDVSGLFRIRAVVMAEAELKEYLMVWANWDSPIYVFHDKPYDSRELEKKNLAGVVIP